MLKELTADITFPKVFNTQTLSQMTPYFETDFVGQPLSEKKQYFYNLRMLSKYAMGLAHCTHHHHSTRQVVILGHCKQAKDQVLSKRWCEIIGAFSGEKRSDQISFDGATLDGHKRWFSHLDQAEYAIMQVPDSTTGLIKNIYLDLTRFPHDKTWDFYYPIGMEIARPGAINIDNQVIDPDWVLGTLGTQQFFEQNLFQRYGFITNYFSLAKELFLDIKAYEKKFECDAEFEIRKLEVDICTLQSQWEQGLDLLDQKTLNHLVWNLLNVQYAFSKKTLIRVIQLALELGVTYFVDARSEFSQRFRDSITFCSHMYPLYRFGQEMHMLDIERAK